MVKDTTKLVEELGLSPDFKTFYNENKDYVVAKTLAELLEELIKKHGLKKAQIIRDTDMSEVYAYQIFSGLRIPERRKLLPLAIAMQLTLDEIQSLLKAAGFPPLYVKLPFDCVVLYGIYKKLSVLEINAMLYEYGLETLG